MNADRSKRLIKSATIDPRASEAYGELRESVHIAGYTFERACGKLEWLLDNDHWRSVGHGFTDINAFMDSVRLDTLKGAAEQRKRIAARIKALQPKVSNRSIAKVLGVGRRTVDRDVGPNGPPGEKRAGNAKGGKTETGPNGPPALSGAAAAKTVERAERIKGRQQEVDGRVARVAFDAERLGKFSLILADPPWDDDFGANRRSTENHYPTMSIEDILAMPVSDIAHEQCMLFMWATSPMLELALNVVKAWGFDYRTQIVWVKPSIGTGQYVRQRHELLLVCRRGDHPAPNATLLPDSVIEAPRGEHSAKPEIFHEVIERMYPEATRIELFRRGAPRTGWSAWGAEAQEAAE